VEVQIKNVDYYRQQIDLAVIGEGRPYEEEE
jgi:ribonuclease R